MSVVAVERPSAVRSFRVLMRLAFGAARREVLLFWLILIAVDSSGYGSVMPASPTDWYPFISLLLVALAMGAGEARFHLYRRVWTVAGLNDAFAIGLAVVEASLLITFVNLLFPDGYRPLRILAPVLAAPAIVIAVGLFRLLPRLLTWRRPTGNRLLVVIPGASPGCGQAAGPAEHATAPGLFRQRQVVQGVRGRDLP